MTTDPQIFHRFLAGSREFALKLVGGASMLLNETKDLQVTTAMRHAITETATGLADAKHDLMHEIVRSEEMIEWNEHETVIGAMLKGIHQRMFDARAQVERLILYSSEAADSGETTSLIELLLAEIELDIGDSPELPDFTIPTGEEHLVMVTTTPDFHDLLVSDRHKREDEFLLEHFTKNQEDPRDVITSIIFDNQGFVLFRVIDDECRYSGDEFCHPFYSITLFVMEPADRNALFKAILKHVPDTETEKRTALVTALQAALEKQFCRGLLDSTGIRSREFRNTIYTS